jgi:hypothetical protein
MTGTVSKTLQVAPAASALVALPALALACGVCADSMFAYEQPWLLRIYAIVIAWYLLRTMLIVNWGVRIPLSSRTPKSLIGWLPVATVAIPVFGLCGFYFLAALIALSMLVKMTQDVIVQSGTTVWVLRVLAIVGLALMSFTAASGIQARAQLSPLEAYDRYAGTSDLASRVLSAQLARDRTIDPAQLIASIESGDPARQSKALWILKHRNRKEDLVVIANQVMEVLPTKITAAPEVGTPRYILYEWLDSLGLQHIRAQADLQAWLAQQTTSTGTTKEE